MTSEKRVIGIDLGTTNSVCAIVLGAEPEVIPNSEGANKTPSVVAFLKDDEVVVGEIARRQAATNPTKTITSVKRLIGRTFADVEEADELYPYQLVDHENELLIDIDGMGYRPEQISALVIKKLKESAEAYLNEEVAQAVITVPAFFDDIQRQATIQAAEMAGLEVLRLLNEPTAAAMAYGLGRSSQSDEIVAVYDFGGGTFDITILEISDKTFEVRTSTGDTQLGGDDLDDCIVQHVLEQFERENGISLTQDPVTIRRLKEVAERAKCELSTTTQSRLSLPFLAEKDGQPVHLEQTLDRDDFEDMIDPFVRRTVKSCKRALEEAGLSKKDIDKVILVGGTTRIPLVQDSVEDFFDQAPFMGVNPDEVVALGAATQAGIFEGMVQEVLLLDVTPHSLGIEVEGGKVSKIIDKNSTIPIKAAKTFTTTEANQAFVNIHVLQGESNESAENKSLGKFSLMDIPPAAAGIPRVRVTFFINADGVMDISAEEMSSGRAEAITIVHSQLSNEESDKRKRRKSRKTKRKRKDHRAPSRFGSQRSGTGTSSSLRGAETDSVSNLEAPLRPKQTPTPDDESHPGRQIKPAASSDDSSSYKSDTSTQERERERPQFAVLGDAEPGDSDEEHVTRRSFDKKEVSMSPVDYSKAPPMYSSVQTPPEGLSSQAEDIEDEIVEKDKFQKQVKEDFKQSPSETNFKLEKKQDKVPDFDRDISGTGEQPLYAEPDVLKGKIPESEGAAKVSDDAANTMFDSKRGAAFHSDETRYDESFSGTNEESSRVGSIVLPEQVSKLVRKILEHSSDGDTDANDYIEALKALSTELYQRSNNFEIMRARCLLHMKAGQESEALSILEALRQKHGTTHAAEVLKVHEACVANFGNSANYLRAQAYAKEITRDLAGACADYERASKMDPAEGDTVELKRLYEILSDRDQDPQAKFKLVKILLKSNEVDDAIEILQELQDDEQFRSRSLKVLGLCYWQKNMHYLAWQKFKSLKVDDDLKDILYRLASDMESTDQVANAVNVLEHLNEHSPSYRDTEARLKKLNYRLKLQKEEYESHRDVPILSQDSRFTILEEINRGSMGIIFKANDKMLNDIVALKMLNDYLCSDPSAVERFTSEARAAKKLSHPYIVRIHDLFEIETKRFISMEYIEGMDLKRMLMEKTTFTLDMVLYYLRQICDAISYAHRLGIVHRDIKPANVMVTTDNQIKITDFGIAKILRGDDITKSGTAVIGTPLYMAPEQIIGDSIDARTDIYSLGIMLYEIVAGNPPFYLGNIEYHHIHTAPPELPSSIPAGLAKIIMKMIEKEPGNRYQKIEEMLADMSGL